MRKIPLERARRLALGAQGLDGPRPGGKVDARHLRKMFRTIGVLQIDSVNVLERAHHLTSFARLGVHGQGLLGAAMERREIFEYWGHVASFLPVETWPLWRHKMEGMEKWSRVLELEEREPGYIESVEEEVARRGALAPADLEDPGDRAGSWWGWSKGKIALEYLFACGKLTVSQRRNFTRYYDLAERVIPVAHFNAEPVPRADAHRTLLMMGAKALGIATVTDLVDYYRLPIVEARAAITELAAEGRLEEVDVEGWNEPTYLHPEVRTPRTVEQVRLLCPFDDLIFFRDRVERLFGFHYRVEIYVPRPQRRFGYYVLPLLVGDRLIGRVDLKADRANRKLLVPGAFAEDGAAGEVMARQLADELRLMAGWLGLGEIAVGRKGNLVDGLKNVL